MKEYHLFVPKCIVVVVRDDLGRVVAALSKRINAPLGAVEAEAKAFETGTVCKGYRGAGHHFGR